MMSGIVDQSPLTFSIDTEANSEHSFIPDIILQAMLPDYWEEHCEAKNVGMHTTCLACMLPSLHLVSVVFGMLVHLASPTSR